MRLRQYGICHKNAGAPERERLALDPRAIARETRAIRRIAPRSEIVFLSTCNRVELYLAAASKEDLPSDEALVARLARDFHLPPEWLRAGLRVRRGVDVIRHLFSVTSGLESQVLGDTHIAGQVKDAYRRACALDGAGTSLHRLFQTAFRTSRRVARETSFGAGRVSIPSIAVEDLARRRADGLDRSRIVLVGAGVMADETLKHLTAARCEHVVIVNRTESRARRLAKKWSMRAAAWNLLWSEIIEADIVVCATSATAPILSRELFDHIVGPSRMGRPLIALDLSVPRNIDASLVHSPEVRLISIDELSAKSEKNLAARRRELPAATSIVNEETRAFIADSRRRRIDRMIHAA